MSKSSARPLSPHLQIYRPQLTSVLSFAHRLTGVALGIYAIALVAWLMAAAAGSQPYSIVQNFMQSLFGQVLLVGGISSWIVARRHATAARWIAVASVGVDLLVTVGIWIANTGRSQPETGRWLEECNFNWISQFGIRFHLALDGLSLALLLLTYFLGIVAVLSSWTEIRRRVGFFHFNLLWVLAGITGVFLAEDLFVFYLFWELMLVPMYFLIGIWGHERRIYAATKFFLFTQLSGLLMLVAIISLAVLHQRATGVFTFDYEQLLNTTLSPRAARLARQCRARRACR